MRKGIFMANDTHANIFLNLLMREYGCFPEDYQLVGFDDSPIAYEAMSLLVSQMNEQKKRRTAPQTKVIHKVITPILIRRDTTD